MAALEELEGDWEDMSAAALQAYEERFAPRVWFHHVIELCRDLHEAGTSGLSRYWTNPDVLRDGGRHLKHAILDRARGAR